MNDYVRLYESMDLGQLTLLKTELRRHGVTFRVLFERTLEIGGPYEMGRQGAIIEVAEADLERATRVLADNGVVLDYEPTRDYFAFIRWFDRRTRAAPLLGRLPLDLRLFTTIGAVVLLAFLLLAFLSI